MTIDEARLKGFTRIRRPIWLNPEDYLMIHPNLIPFVDLYSPTQKLIGEPTPQRIFVPLWMGLSDEDGFEVYTGKPNPAELGRLDP